MYSNQTQTVSAPFKTNRLEPVFLRNKRLIETIADDLLHAMSIGTNLTVVHLQTLHNDALGMGWIGASCCDRGSGACFSVVLG